jgi:hypothetical protein
MEVDMEVVGMADTEEVTTAAIMAGTTSVITEDTMVDIMVGIEGMVMADTGTDLVMD